MEIGIHINIVYCTIDIYMHVLSFELGCNNFVAVASQLETVVESELKKLVALGMTTIQKTVLLASC